MYSRLLFTFATITCLTGAYAVYAALIRPLVVVPELPAQSDTVSQHPVAHRPVENVRVAQSYLSEQSWAAESQYMMRSGQTFIYTQRFEHQQGDPQIRFVPFAMVWLQKDRNGRETAVSLVSDSALLKFASAFDQVNPNPGRVVRAVLDGEVQVKGPDGLALAGKQFVFDESAPSLVSTNLVQFQYGSHSGRGRTLNVKLIPTDGPPSGDRPRVYGIRTVRLGSGTDPVTRRFEPVQLDFRVPQQDQQRLVKVRCSSDLEYDVEKHTALFSQSVRAHSMTGGAGYDSLECDKLWLQFEPVPATLADAEVAAANGKSDRSFQQIETDLVFRRMIAEGKDVKFQSTERQLRADMKRMEYDAVERRLQLTDSRDVCVSQKGSSLWVPDVEVRFGAETNSVTEVLCRGAGRLEMTRPETNELEFFATWKKQLRKSTDPANGLDYIELQRQASFRQPRQQTGLAAELVRLWLAPMSLSIPTGQSDAGPQSAPEPKRLVAERDVALVSPQLVARTSELDVRFEEGSAQPRLIPVSRSSTTIIGPVESPTLQNRDDLQPVSLREPATPRPAARKPGAPNQLPRREPSATGGKGVQPAGHRVKPAERNSLGPPIDIPMSTNMNEPLEVIADRIVTRMRRVEGASEPELTDVDTSGHVKVVQRRTGEPPLTAEGDRLHLQNIGPQQEIVQLFGQPAHLRDRGMHVEGREVNMDRGANRVWVKGNGLLQLPVPPGTELASFGQSVNDPDLDVWWEESMEFDGQTANFIGKVRAELGLGRMYCEQMDVKLTSRLSFADLRLEQQPELATVRCHENVSFESSDYKDNKLVMVQRGKIAEFSFNHQQGTTFAQGPGNVQVWQRVQEDPSGSGQRDIIQANRPIDSVGSSWDYTKVTFKGRMTGNIDRQQSTFHDTVRIVHGPVGLPNETIDADNLTPTSGSMRCDKLEFTFRSKSADTPKAYQQLIGWGNAQIEGRGYYANANEISFDGSKGLYMLRAHGNQVATIAQDTPQGRRREATGRRIEFNRITKAVKVDAATGGTGGFK
jgi:hypothetical protein